MINLTETDEGIVVPVQAKPKAKRNGIVGVHDGRLRVAVTEAPERGKANDAIVKVVAKSLELRRSNVSIFRGATSTSKELLVTSVGRDELMKRIDACLCDA